MKYYKIKQGATLKLMLLGLSILLFSILLFNTKFILTSIITFIIGLTVFISIKGVIIKDGKLKMYFSFLGLKIGKWISIVNYDIISLSNINESTVINTRTGSSSVNTNSYIIILHGVNMKKIELFEDTSYNTCKSKLKEIEVFLDIKSIDRIAIVKNKFKTKRKR